MNQQMHMPDDESEQRYDTRELIKNAEEVLKPKDSIDLLISGDLRLEDVVGYSLPEREFSVYHDVESQRKRLEEIKSKYIKSPDEVVVTEKKGLYSRIKEVVMGTKKEEIIQGTPGPITIAQETYETIKTELGKIKEGMPEINKGMSVLSSYVGKKEEEMGRLSDTLFSLDESLEKVDDTISDLESRLENDQVTSKEKVKIVGLRDKASRYKANIRSHQSALAAKIEIYDDQIKMYGRELSIARRYVDVMHSDITALDAMLEGIHVSLELQDVKNLMVENSASMRESRERLKAIHRDCHGYQMATTKLMTETILNGDPYRAFTADEHESMSHTEYDFMATTDREMDEQIRRAKAIVIKKNDVN